MGDGLQAGEVAAIEACVRSAIRDLRDGAEATFLSGPVEVWTADPAGIAASGLVAAARPLCWAIFVGGTDLGLARVARREGAFAFASFAPSGHSRDAWAALELARRSAGPVARLLDLSSLKAFAAWGTDGAGSHAFVPVLVGVARPPRGVDPGFADHVRDMATRHRGIVRDGTAGG